MSRAVLLVALALSASACVTYPRGTLGMASLVMPTLETELIAEGVEGRDCDEWLDRRQSEAVEEAIASAPGANALVNATFTFQNFCLVVRGDAVRIP